MTGGPAHRYGSALMVVSHTSWIAEYMHYLDAHSGSLQLLSSVILVAVTIVYTVLTRSLAKAAREALRPYVYLDLSFRHVSEMVIIIGNSGTRVAGKVTVTLIGSNREKLAALIRELPLEAGIGHLSPGSIRRYSVIVDSSELLPKDAPAATFDFKIRYHDGARIVTDRQSFDLQGYRSALVFGYDEPLVQIATELKEIARKIPNSYAPILFLSARKACPYCRTLLDASAVKCHGCLEWLSGSARHPASVRSVRARRGRRFK